MKTLISTEFCYWYALNREQAYLITSVKRGTNTGVQTKRSDAFIDTNGSPSWKIDFSCWKMKVARNQMLVCVPDGYGKVYGKVSQTTSAVA